MSGLRTGMLVVGLMACSTKSDREIPFWEGGLLLEGSCNYTPAADPLVPFILVAASSDPLINLDTAPDLGQVVYDDDAYRNMMESLNFGSWLRVDFETHFVAAIYYNPSATCDTHPEDWWINQSTGGGLVLEAQFFDSALNCPTDCRLDTQSVVILAIEAEPEISLCRRVRPGCEPS